MTPSIVITGSTHGIGFALADAFLEQGCVVTISSRTASAVEEASIRLASKHSVESIIGIPCDVTNFLQVQHLWDEAKNHFGKIDIWINNAGTASPRINFWEIAPEKYTEVVNANVIGLMYATKVALTGMLQQGYGALYNMEGYGAGGRGMQGLALYGSTKASVHFLNRSLAQELDDRPVIVGAIAPGMVITDMITRQYAGREADLEKAKPILNIIAERPETVSPVLAKKILKNQMNGATISFSSPARMFLKFLAAPFKKRDLFSTP